jgi:hypothetical protein
MIFPGAASLCALCNACVAAPNHMLAFIRAHASASHSERSEESLFAFDFAVWFSVVVDFRLSSRASAATRDLSSLLILLFGFSNAVEGTAFFVVVFAFSLSPANAPVVTLPLAPSRRSIACAVPPR